MERRDARGSVVNVSSRIRPPRLLKFTPHPPPTSQSYPEGFILNPACYSSKVSAPNCCWTTPSGDFGPTVTGVRPSSNRPTEASSIKGLFFSFLLTCNILHLSPMDKETDVEAHQKCVCNGRRAEWESPWLLIAYPFPRLKRWRCGSTTASTWADRETDIAAPQRQEHRRSSAGDGVLRFVRTLAYGVVPFG